MSNVLFIGPVFLKSKTSIQQNVDSNSLVPHIERAQQDNIQSILGSALYDELILAVSGGTKTVDQSTLLNDYVKPAHAEWALYHALPYIKLKLTNKTIAKGKDEFLDAAGKEDVTMLQDAVRNEAERLTDRIRLFLCDNSDSFPAYMDSINISDVKPQRTGYFSGFYLADGGTRNGDFWNACGNCGFNHNS